MIDTKENILMTALRLFARDGYEAVSVSTIAGELGMTKGALYKHYKNKRDIFDSIVERMYQIDAERSRQYEVPEEKYEAAPTAYANVSVDSVKSFATAQYEFWTADEFASDFRKMLSLERYRNADAAKLYNGCIAEGPVEYLQDIFREMMSNGQLKESDPKQLALEFYAPMYLLISIADTSDDKASLLKLLDNHIERFIKNNKNQEKHNEIH